MQKRKVKKKPIIIIIIMIALGLIIVKNYSKPTSKKHNKNKQQETEIKETKQEKSKSLSLVMVGDVLIHEAVFKDAYQSDGSYNFNPMFEEVKPLLNDYDLRYCNQESIIGGKELTVSGYPAFNSPEEIGDTIVDLGFNLIGLANNHAFDKGEKAILNSNAYWNKKNVVTAGSYSNQSDRDEIKIQEKNGIKYAFLAYTTGINGNHLPAGKEYLINIYDKEKVKQDVDKIKDQVDVIIVAMHWGDEYTNIPTNSEKEIANYLSSIGVNIIIGTHPHVIQPIEYINDTLVIYSLGNFISNQLVLGINPAIGLLVGIDITIEDNNPTYTIKKKELLYSYSNNSTNFKVIPFSKMNEKYLKDYQKTEQEYLNIVGNEN